MKSTACLESLFQHLKKSSSKGNVVLTYLQIEEIIGQELSYAEKTDNRYWSQPKLKELAAKYNVVLEYIDTVAGTIHFLIN